MATTTKVTLDEVTQEQIDTVHWIIDESDWSEYFQVESESDPTLEYLVKWHECTKRWSCTCDSWAHGSGPVARAGLGCKHCLWTMAWKRQHELLVAECREREAQLKAARRRERVAERWAGYGVDWILSA